MFATFVALLAALGIVVWTYYRGRIYDIRQRRKRLLAGIDDDR